MRREPANRCSLLVRGITREMREEDIRYEAQRYGSVRDVYVPLDHYTREVRGIGFVEFHHPADAEDCKHGMDRMYIRGHEISVVYAKMGRKRPDEFRRGGGGGGGGGGGRRDDYRRGGGGGYQRGSYNSPGPRRGYSPPRRGYRKRSYSPSRSRSYTRSYTRSKSISRSRSRTKSHLRSVTRSSNSYTRSPQQRSGSGSRSNSDSRSKSSTRSRSVSRGRSRSVRSKSPPGDRRTLARREDNGK